MMSPMFRSDYMPEAWSIKIRPIDAEKHQACLFRGSRFTPLKCWKDTQSNFTREFAALQNDATSDPLLHGVDSAFLAFGTQKGYLSRCAVAKSKGIKKACKLLTDDDFANEESDPKQD